MELFVLSKIPMFTSLCGDAFNAIEQIYTMNVSAIVRTCFEIVCKYCYCGVLLCYYQEADYVGTNVLAL